MSTAAIVGKDGQGVPASKGGPAGSGGSRWSLWRRQVGGIVRLELGKVLASRWSLIGWGLALVPVLLLAVAMVGTLIARLHGQTAGWTEQQYAMIYQALVLRLCVFFGCLAIFINLIRGEQHQRTLHYYLLAPVRREVLVGGKFLGGWIGAALLFGGAALVMRLLLLIPDGTDAALRSLTGGPWLGLTLAYVGVTLLACLAYVS